VPGLPTQADVLAWMDTYRLRVRQATVVRRFASVRFYHRWMVETGQRPDNPTEGIHLRHPAPVPKEPFTEAELRRIYKAAKRAQERAVVLLLADTGLRLGEVTGIRREHVDWERGTIRVTGKGGGERLVAPSQRTLDALRFCMDGQDYPWYSQRTHGPMTRDGMYRLLRRLGERAGVAHCHPHRFRVTWACLFLDGGGDLGDAQVLMGHQNISQTVHYGAWSKQRRALQAQRAHALSDRIA
jgi:integrase